MFNGGVVGDWGKSVRKLKVAPGDVSGNLLCSAVSVLKTGACVYPDAVLCLAIGTYATMTTYQS